VEAGAKALLGAFLVVAGFDKLDLLGGFFKEAWEF
jgi:hypothetical protein